MSIAVAHLSFKPWLGVWVRGGGKVNQSVFERVRFPQRNFAMLTRRKLWRAQNAYWLVKWFSSENFWRNLLPVFWSLVSENSFASNPKFSFFFCQTWKCHESPTQRKDDAAKRHGELKRAKKKKEVFSPAHGLWDIFNTNNRAKIWCCFIFFEE